MKTKLQNKKYYIIDIIIILIVTGLTIFYLLKNGILYEIKNISKISWQGLLTLCLAMLFIVLFESFIIFRSSKMAQANLTFRQAFETYFFGNLGSSVTPMKAGHFPFIFYYLTRNKVTIEKSLSTVCLNQIVYSTTTMLLYFSLFVFCAVKNTAITVLNITVHLQYIALIGFLFNVGTITLVLLMSYSRRFHSLIINICAWFLIKLKKIESKETYKNEQIIKMKIYKDNINYFLKHFYKFLPLIAIYIFTLMILCGFPYIIYLFLTGSSFNFASYLFFFSLNQTMSYITNVIPVPGGTGVAEFTFLTIFGLVYPENLIGVAMIVWRVVAYYLPMLVGFIIFIVFMIKNRAKQQEIQKNSSTESI